MSVPGLYYIHVQRCQRINQLLKVIPEYQADHILVKTAAMAISSA